MDSKERKNVVFTILGKTLLYIVAIAMIFALIILAWEKYDWLPLVKSIIRGVVIPILLGGLLVYLLRHVVSALNDKWKPFVMLVIFLTGTISSYNYHFDDVIIPRRRGSSEIKFRFYQVCPLKNKKGVFLCTRTKEIHPYRMSSKSGLQQWRTDFINREKGSIKSVALSSHFFKVLHPSDHFEPYQAVATTSTTRHGAISPEQLVLLEIRQPDTIKRWEDNVLYIFLSLIVGFSVLFITLMGKGVLNEAFRGK